jgi:toxin ParE1/3/4
MRYLDISEDAKAELREARRYIAKDNPRAAARFRAAMVQRWQTLRRFPEMGPLRPKLGPGFRTFVVGNYLIVYRVAAESIEIVRLLHGARDIDTLLKDTTDTD